MKTKEEYFDKWLKRVHQIGVNMRLWKEETMLSPKYWAAYYPNKIPHQAIAEDLKYVK